MEWESLYCPNRNCCCYGKPFKTGCLIKDGSSRGHPRARCQACGRPVVLSYGTAHCGLDAEPAVFELAVRALAEGNSLRATARMVLTDKDTGCAWLDRAARPCRRVMLYLWHELHVRECNWTNHGVLCIPSQRIGRERSAIVKPMAMLGFGWPLLPSGGWCWRW